MGLTVVADDLTGACDTAALFTGAGRTLVLLGLEAPSGMGIPRSEVMALDTDSRSLSAPEATARLRGIASWLIDRLRDGRLYKKVDSTMRGPVGAEIATLLAACDLRAALLCPALPEQGRTVQDGILRVASVPVHESPIGCDPDYRASTSNLVELLTNQTSLPVSRIPLGPVRGGEAMLVDAFNRAPSGVIVADAETRPDLACIARAALRIDRLLLVGSAGLAASLAQALGLAVGLVPLPRGRAWLFVVGSRHPASRAQLLALRTAGIPGIESGGPGRQDPVAVLGALARGEPAFVASAGGPAGLDPASRSAVAEDLARTTRDLLDRARPDVVLLTGGETARAVARTLGAISLELDGVPASGLALGELIGPGVPHVRVLTKAGGFGPADLFVRLLEGASP